MILILTRFAHEGCGRKSHYQDVIEFSDIIRELELVDIPLHGKKFTTLSNNRGSMVKLDIFLSSLDWYTKFPMTFQNGLASQLSDHYPSL